jgi:hypothetical protein
VATKRTTLIFIAWCQSELLTALVLNCPEMLSSKRSSPDDFVQIMKERAYIPGKVINVECWNSMTVSPHALFLQNITEIKSAV